MLWWILYAYLSLQGFITAGILFLLLRDKLRASDRVTDDSTAPMRLEDQQQAYQ